MNQQLSTEVQQQGLTLTDKAREIAGRVKYMIQNGRNLSDNEVWALSQYSAANDLNPFAGECYYLPGSGPCPGIAGWRKKAQEQLNWEAENQKELGAHFWTETREATPEEARHNPDKGDIAVFVTLHDWLTNKRWRRAYFDTLRELKEVGYTLEEAQPIAKSMTGPEPTWTGIGVVYANENFGPDKFNRSERAAKRAEKLALRKRFPRINLPEPVNSDVEYYDANFAEQPRVEAPKHTEAELIGDLYGAPAPVPAHSTTDRSEPPANYEPVKAPSAGWPLDVLDYFKNEYQLKAINQAANMLNLSGFAYDTDLETLKSWVTLYKSLRADGAMTPQEAAKQASAELAQAA